MSELCVGIIGAGGQIGRTLLSRFAGAPGVLARGICRNELTAAPLRLAGFDVRCGAVSDPDAAEELLDGCDVVVNCAAATALPGTARREERAIVRGLLSVKGIRRLIHFSSVAVYGTCITTKNRYSHPRPDYPFGRDKLNLEQYLRREASRSSLRELVVLRMGHVYGAQQWLSRYIFDELKGGGWRLPFGGRTTSNAIHVKNVASAVRTLALGRQVGTFNLFDWPQSTWREVCDWNTSAIGAPRIPDLDEAASEVLREHFARISRAPAQQLVREIAAWGKSLPLALASSSQQVRFVVMTLMASLQSPTLEAHAVKRFFGGHAAGRARQGIVEAPWIFSQPAPGPCVDYTREVTADDSRAVAEWHEGYSSPDALAPFAPRSRDGVEAQA